MFQIIADPPSPAGEQGLLVVAEPVKKIEHRISGLRVLRRRRVIAWGKIDAVVDVILKNLAVESIAIDPTLSVRRLVRDGHASENQNKKTCPEDAKHEVQ